MLLAFANRMEFNTLSDTFEWDEGVDITVFFFFGIFIEQHN